MKLDTKLKKKIKKKLKKIGKSKNLADRPKSAKTFWGIKTCVLGEYAV